MGRRNLTVQLDEETIRQAKILAAERGTSVSGLVAREPEQLVARNARYEEAMRRAIELMEESEPHGGRTWRRDELHGESQLVAERQVTFVDINVLAHAYDRSGTGKQPVAEAQLRMLWRDGTGTLSTQVLQVFYVLATRKLPTPIRRTTARRILSLYAAWPVVQVGVPLVAASELEERHTLSFWDALIVESARPSGATRLLTEDLQHGWVVGGVTVDNPFA